MSAKKDKIIWLEDKPELNKEIVSLFNNEQANIILCKDLASFSEVTIKEANDPETSIKGFILDILIHGAESLDDLNLPHITTPLGFDTGYMVLLEYIRNMDGDSPLGDKWKDSPVLMLTTLDQALISDRYKRYIDDETQKNKNLTKWLSKADDHGNQDYCLNEIKEWLKSIP